MSFTKLPSYLSPVGTARSLWLLIPDTKFSPEGNYSVKLSFTGNDATELASFLDSKLDESVAEAQSKNVGKKITKADPQYSWNDNGTLSVNFKMKASGTTKDGKQWTRKPPIFNADLSTYEGITEIPVGSKLVVSYTPAIFYTQLTGAGVSMRLEAVQVVTLGHLNTYGFIDRSISNDYVQRVAEELEQH